MDAVIKKVKEYVDKHHMITAGDTVVAGVSGGADSVCLLFVLQEIRRKIPFYLAVVHINHGIRKDASQDAQYVESLCREMGLPFYLYERDVKELALREGLSEEEAGRQVRYRAFEEVLQKESSHTAEGGCGRIAVAHNQNDRAETMLFQLFRGSGIRGLIGIRPVREDVIRPLLCLKREEIEAFLEEKSISYCIDYTNEDDTYTRNKIRHHILPAVRQQVSEKAVEHMAAAADILLEAEDFLSAETRKAYDLCAEEQSGRIVIETEAFATLHPYLQKQVLFQAVESIVSSRKDITAVHIQDMLSLFEREGNRTICLPYGLRVKRQYGQVILYPEKEDMDAEADSDTVFTVQPLSPKQPETEVFVPGLGTFRFSWMEQNEKQFQTPQENLYTKWFDYDKIKQILEIRTRRTGDYLTINGQQDRQSIKKYMIQEKIPADKRDAMRLLSDGSHILWVIGYRISSEYKVSKDTKHLLKVQFRGGQ